MRPLRETSLCVTSTWVALISWMPRSWARTMVKPFTLTQARPERYTP